MQTILRCVTLRRCQFHKLKRQAQCSKREGKEGNTNFIMLRMTAEPHVIGHATKATDYSDVEKKFSFL